MSNALKYDYYPDSLRDELLDGQLVAMAPMASPSHADVVVNITRIFSNFLLGKTCKVYPDSVDVFLSESDRVVPDVSVVCNRDIIKHNGIHGAPDLVVEVLSRSTASRDRGYKKSLYEKHGIKEYWLVDIGNRIIEVYLLKAGRYEISGTYAAYDDWELEDMPEERRHFVRMEFKTSIFDDLIISVEDVFRGVL